ncbi:hypothetical protein RchiOBHm_Chr4g0425451 [Rosa chinensis]|uniref:Uncharacterized protein n=1 Tax=Rosa chinensis TaxID=74649 RepID=A0A2P6QZ56_ROSCH|nr:hypothetical protein RchiOBHm_Chr4g0425451 [Rosa chinensis]
MLYKPFGCCMVTSQTTDLKFSSLQLRCMTYMYEGTSGRMVKRVVISEVDISKHINYNRYM